MALDTRKCLYGGRRLSDAQVRCLRDGATGQLRHVRRGWTSRTFDEAHSQGTVTALCRQGLLRVKPGNSTITIMEEGRKILAAIDAADARTM